MKKNLCAPILVALLAGCSAEEELSGELLVQEKGCVACHGSDGRSTAAIYPNLNMQWERYLRTQLLRYRSGERNNAIMNGFAASLTDQEIRTLAQHYGRNR